MNIILSFSSGTFSCVVIYSHNTFQLLYHTENLILLLSNKESSVERRVLLGLYTDQAINKLALTRDIISFKYFHHLFGSYFSITVGISFVELFFQLLVSFSLTSFSSYTKHDDSVAKITKNVDTDMYFSYRKFFSFNSYLQISTKQNTFCVTCLFAKNGHVEFPHTFPQMYN